MSSARERAWVRLLNSPVWRRLARSSTGGRILRSDALHALDLRRRRIFTTVQESRDPVVFDAVETCVVFLGHVKSGGSLLGALLDAHAEAVMADEVDILRYVEAGFRRDQIFHLLAKGARRESLKGRVTARRLEPYSLAVPDQWQGAYRTVKVIGESRAGPTTRRLGNDLALLGRLRDLMQGTDLRFIHVVRSPYDPIGAMVARSGKTLEKAVAEYEQRCDVLSQLRRNMDPEELHTVNYEDLIHYPAHRLADACRFVGLDPSPDYLTACAGIVNADRQPERDAVSWSDDVMERLDHLIARTDFLNRYKNVRPGEIAWRTS